MKNNKMIRVFAILMICSAVFLGIAGFAMARALKSDPAVVQKIELLIEQKYGEKINLKFGPSGDRTEESFLFPIPEFGIEYVSFSGDVEIV